MSEDRDQLKEHEEPGTENDDVEAHVLRNSVLKANDEPGDHNNDDDVEAHILK